MIKPDRSTYSEVYSALQAGSLNSIISGSVQSQSWFQQGQMRTLWFSVSGCVYGPFYRIGSKSELEMFYFTQILYICKIYNIQV